MYCMPHQVLVLVQATQLCLWLAWDTTTCALHALCLALCEESLWCLRPFEGAPVVHRQLVHRRSLLRLCHCTHGAPPFPATAVPTAHTVRHAHLCAGAARAAAAHLPGAKPPPRLGAGAGCHAASPPPRGMGAGGQAELCRRVIVVVHKS